MEHPETLLELTRQRQSQALLLAERRRLLRASSPQPPGARRSVLALVLEVQLPRGRRLRLRVGRMARSFPF